MKSVVESKKVSELACLCKRIRLDRGEEMMSDINRIATEIFINLYAKGGEFESLNYVRPHMYYGGHKLLEALPPTDDSLKLHVLRSVFQTYVWVTAIEPTPEVLDPFKYGWTSESGTTKPILMLNSHVPANLNTDNFCKCKKMWIRNCSCKKIGVMCDIACSCRGQVATCARAQFEPETLE